MARARLQLIAAIAVASLPAVAVAQIPEVSTDGSLADPAAPPPAPEPAAPAAPVVIPIGPDGQVQEPALAEDDGFYYRDDSSPTGRARSQGIYVGGPVPGSHVVRSGDTLWDITWFYFNNPFSWPKVWAYNPEISNPHWIYPGDQVRLYPEGEAPATADVDLTQPDIEPADPQVRPRTTPGSFGIRQLAFVDTEELEFAASVDGSTEAKLLLSTGDSIYLSYPAGKPPKIGKRYAVYRPRQEVTHPNGGRRVGAYVRVIGELEVVSVKKGKRARAIITDATDVIERGALVGPLQRQFRSVTPAPNEIDLQGTIVAQLFADQLIGARHVVFIDKGSEAGVKAGNRMFVVRRGDAYKVGSKLSNTGQDDRRYPARAIGEVIVVETGKTSSLALVTLAIQEIGAGDLVLMRKARQ